MASGLPGKRWATPTRLIVSSFALFVLTGTVLLMLPHATRSGASPDLIDALFTATSAVCVTGLSVVNTAGFWSTFGHVVIMLLIQAGGLGLMIFATLHALLTGRRVGLRERILIQEQTGQPKLSGLVVLARRIIFTTLLLEMAGTVILGTAIGRARNLSVGEAAWQGLFHAVSGFCNAGFDILGNNLVEFQSNAAVILTVGFLIILGGIGFHVLVDVYVNRGKWKELSLHSRLVLKLTGGFLLLGTLAFAAIEWDNPGTLGPLSLKGKILSAWFQSVTPRTAGFNSIMEGSLRAPAAFLTVILMFIGASPGGTGGGVKTTTFAVVARWIGVTVQGGRDVVFGRRRIPQDIISKAITIIFLSMTLVIVATMAIMFLEEAPFLDVLFEVASAFGTVGLSRELTPSLTAASKLILSLTMFAGRVGPLSLVAALSKHKGEGTGRYPEERVTVG